MHLPSGFARTLRAHAWPLLTAWGYRVWIALVTKSCRPDCRSVAEHFGISKSKAARELNHLIDDVRLLRRERRPVGRNVFAWAYLVTDEPDAWRDDAALDEKFWQALDAEVERVRTWHAVDAADATETLPPVPEPDEQVTDLSGDPQVAPCPTSEDIPKRISLREIYPPTPVPVDQVVHRPSRFERRLTHLLHREPELEPHIPHALALLHGVGLPPLSRIRHARTIALGLRLGLRLDELLTFLTREMRTARNSQAVMAHRLARLAAELDRRLIPSEC